MEVISSHTNADFDALASMVAAKKLYPDASIVFAGSQEASMRAFFLESTAYAIETTRLRAVDVDTVARLILVDNRNPHRLGKLAAALRNPGVSVHIYDHHPVSEGDIRGEVEVVSEVGATTTLMVELLLQRNLPITPVEATIFALGIYEETGSLTYVSTTPRDAMAAAAVIERGANLNVVADFLVRELTAEQVAVLNDLLRAAKSYDINGVKVVIASLTTPHYVPDVAGLAHRMRDMESLDVLFLVVQMGDRTHVIGRSRIPQVNAGAVLQHLGGGGHHTAASAVVKEFTSFQTAERLISILKLQVLPGRTAGQVMSAPVKTVPAGSTIAQAGELMTRFSVNVLPVADGAAYLGIITREVVQKALFHNLGRYLVDQFMTTGIKTATPDAPMDRIEKIMLEERQRFLPVLGEDGSIAGAITRTDLLRSLHEQRLEDLPQPDGERMPAVRNVRSLFEERLPEDARDVLKQIGGIADAVGFSVYLVGGIVRDIFLRVGNLDIDLVVEGDGITFAGMIVKSLGGRMRTHQKFGTAVVMLPGGLKLDIATARLEFYEAPAALPTIELSSIKKDLYRRDFTMNTLAVRLNSRHYGELIDFFGGLRDIKEKVIRILHNLSFVEDPTRVFRAIRFEQRFGFHISKHTLNLVKTAVNMRLFTRLSGERIWDELLQMFSEADPSAVVRRMKELDVLRFIHPALRHPGETDRIFSSVREALIWHRLLYLDEQPEQWFLSLLALLDGLKDGTAAEVLERLSAPVRTRKRLQNARIRTRGALSRLERDTSLTPGMIYEELHACDLETLLFMMAKAKGEAARKSISLYITRLRGIHVEITGDDLKRLGVPPGPRYKKLLAFLLKQKLDGSVRSRDEEIAVIARELQVRPAHPEEGRNAAADPGT